MTVPHYFIVGSHAGTGDLQMLDGPPAKVVALRLVLNPMDIDEDTHISFVGVLGREDVDTLVDALVVAAAEIPYISEQYTEVKEGNDNA